MRARRCRAARDQADFHLTADALTLAELLAGVPRRVGRIFGPRAVPREQAEARPSCARCRPPGSTLAEAARAGAQLEPGLVYRALSYAVHPSWTRGERFTVAQEITGEAPETWYLTARDGAGLDVSDRAAARGRRRDGDDDRARRSRCCCAARPSRAASAPPCAATAASWRA